MCTGTMYLWYFYSLMVVLGCFSGYTGKCFEPCNDRSTVNELSLGIKEFRIVTYYFGQPFCILKSRTLSYDANNCELLRHHSCRALNLSTLLCRLLN